jgi:mono/diheme cytochrome c family protein
MTVCVACHQPTGQGLPMVFPPITNSEYVSGSPERLAAMILKGNIGPITVDGKLYNNMMPGQEALLTDEKIAAVMTYVRSNFGNSAPAVAAGASQLVIGRPITAAPDPAAAFAACCAELAAACS